MVAKGVSVILTMASSLGNSDLSIEPPSRPPAHLAGTRVCAKQLLVAALLGPSVDSGPNEGIAWSGQNERIGMAPGSRPLRP